MRWPEAAVTIAFIIATAIVLVEIIHQTLK